MPYSEHERNAALKLILEGDEIDKAFHSMQSFADWQKEIRPLHVEELDALFKASFENRYPWYVKYEFLAAMRDRFMDLAHFSQELNDHGREVCRNLADAVDGIILKLFSEDVALLEKYNDAKEYADKNLYSVFGGRNRVMVPDVD